MPATRQLFPTLFPWLLSGAVACTVLAVGSAHAAPNKAARTGKARAQASLEEVAVMLSSPDENEVRTALETAATLPPADVLPMLDDRVRAGLPRVLLDVAIDSLMLLDDRGSAPLLNDLARHRRPDVRVRALEVIGRVAAPTAEQALTNALADQVAEVRKAAADALGELGSRTALAPLERALTLGVDGAARALGRVAKPDEVPRLLEQIGKVPTATLKPMFAALLPRRDVPEADKLRAVSLLSALGGEEVQTALTELSAELAPETPARVKKALDEAVQKGKSE